MNTVQLPETAVGPFVLDATLVGGELTVHLRGNADLRAIEPLGRYLAAVHEEIQRLKLPGVTMDFRQLEFMNSSCFKEFVTWINWVRAMPQAEQYKISLLADPKMHWQRRSLNALHCFATTLVSLQS
jgi:hypothetical protein